MISKTLRIALTIVLASFALSSAASATAAWTPCSNATLWKDADPDIPILKEAKAEYAKLQ